MNIIRKIQKVFAFSLIRAVSKFRPGWGTTLAIRFYGKHGMKFNGRPNYISSLSWFDGTDYSLIEIGEGTTISSSVSVLTHDWVLHTIGKSLGHVTDKPLGRILPVKIGAYVFVGRGALLMPGTTIGRGSIIGAGSVVRGTIPEYSIVIGNPCEIIGNSREYFEKKTGLTSHNEVKLATEISSETIA